MRIDGIKLLEGSVLSNATIDSGTTFPSIPDQGELFFRTDANAFYFYDGTDWVKISDATTPTPFLPLAGGTVTGPLTVADTTFTGAVVGLTPSMVQLNNVNNTSDANKPVSTAQAAAIAAAANVQSDWDATTNPAAVLNKPSIYAYNVQSINPVGNTWRKFGSIAVPVGSNVDQIKLSGAMSDGTSLNNAGIEIIFSNAGDAADVTKFTKYWLIGRSSLASRFVVFKQASGALDLWLRSVTGVISTATFNLTSFGAGATIIPASQITSQTTTPAGTIVFDSGNQSTYPPQFYTTQLAAAAAGAVEFPAGVSSGSVAGVSLTAVNQLTNGDLATGTAASLDTLYIQQRTKVNGITNIAHHGAFSWSTSVLTPAEGAGGIIRKTGFKLALRNIDDALEGGNPSGWSAPLAFFQGNGDFAVAGTLASGYGALVGPSFPTGWGTDRSTSKIYSSAGEIVNFGRSGATAPAVAINSELSGGLWNAAASVLFVSNNETSGRSINAGGTVNTAGTDYAEYLVKRADCGVINPGDLVGIDNAGLLTDVFANAVKFMIKSTNPSFVGGDTWANHLAKPLSPERIMPVYKTVVDVEAVPADEEAGTPAVDEVSHRELVSAGDTDAEWAAKEAAYAGALTEFEQSMEEARQKVDRIAFCGQVPVNVSTAVAGQHVIPVNDNGKIGIQLVNDADVTFAQFRKSVGQVIAIYPDGKAKVIVKV